MENLVVTTFSLGDTVQTLRNKGHIPKGRIGRVISVSTEPKEVYSVDLGNGITLVAKPKDLKLILKAVSC